MFPLPKWDYDKCGSASELYSGSAKGLRAKKKKKNVLIVNLLHLFMSVFSYGKWDQD